MAASFSLRSFRANSTILRPNRQVLSARRSADIAFMSAPLRNAGVGRGAKQRENITHPQS